VSRELKRILNVRVASTKQMVWLVNAVTSLKADLAVDAQPGIVRVCIRGSKGEVREISRKILELAAKSQLS